MEYKPDQRRIKESQKNSEFKLNEQRKRALSGPTERFTVLKDWKKTREHIETSTSIRIETLKKIKEQQEQLMLLKKDLENMIEKQKLKSLFTVEYSDMELTLSFGDALFFNTGSASIKQTGESINIILANLFKRNNSDIFIEGHTDNIPIYNKKYPSNWELSSARASAVVRSLIDKGIDPERFAAIGFGEFQPIVSNDNELNRSKNRRVKIILKPKNILPEKK
ncbi:MAG: OmpA family protein [bacterium]